MTTYKINDEVEVNLPRGWTIGKVKKVLPHYGFIGQQETKYEVHGTGKIKFLTITSARQIRPLATPKERRDEQ